MPQGSGAVRPTNGLYLLPFYPDHGRDSDGNMFVICYVINTSYARAIVGRIT